MSTDNRAMARLLVGSRLADLRMTDADLARTAEVDVKTVRGFLGVAQRWPNRESRAKLAQALGWPADELDHLEREGRLSPAADDDTPAPRRSGGVARAAELSDDELLLELTYRMRRYALTQESAGGDGNEASPTKSA